MIINPKNQTYQENYKLLIGSIVPRPIAFVSTISKNDVPNIAPFSFFNGVCSNPPTIAFAPVRRSTDAQPKDTLINIRDTKEFVINIPSEPLVERMVETAPEFAPDINEFDVAGLTQVSSQLITPPRLKEAKISFECTLNQIIEIGDGTAGSGFLVLGTIVLFHIDDDLYENGRISLEKLQPMGRLAGNYYSRVNDIFEVVRKIKPE
ncbi:MAG: flavin reductase family protein [Candidatus Marinimicrobia bacterium]|nr:flavin reductase family protein [Candidatus Neomarinimicrobiota bacterium]